MSAEAQPNTELTDAQQQAHDTSRNDRTRSLDAMHTLEKMMGRAAPGRDRAWHRDIIDALRDLELAIRQQQSSYEEPSSLLVEIAQEQPRLRTWIRQLHRQWNDLANQTRTMRQELELADEVSTSYADIRERLRWLITALHHHRAREADVVYEALSIDLGLGE